MIDRMGRKRALTGLTLVAVGALTLLAPATALAQVPSLSDPVGSTVDTVTGGGGGGSIGGTVGTVTEPVTDTVDKTTGGVGTVVDDTGETVDKVAPGSPVQNTKDTVKETTKTTTDSLGGAVGDVEQTAGAVGGAVFNPDLGIKNPLRKDRSRDGKVSPKEEAAARQKRIAANLEAALAERSDKVSEAAKKAALAKLERNRREQGTPVTLTAPPPRETFLTQLADAAEEAAKKLAFPLGLALMVGAFLMVQGRIDRKDAKLALAPIDSEQDLLSFQ